MNISFDEHGLRLFADAIVTAQKAVELEMANQPPESVGYRGFHNVPWEYKWGIVVNRALGNMPL
jgi:hypothetical protein